MKVLFAMLTPAIAKNFESVVELLAERGHQVRLAVHAGSKAPGATTVVDRLVADLERVTTVTAPAPTDDAWHDLGLALRSCRDYLQFMDPLYHDEYRARAEARVPPAFRRLAERSPMRSRVGHGLLARAIPVAERALPISDLILDFLRAEAPDVLVITPYVGLRTVQPEYVRAAQALGIPTAVAVASWDNLSSKSLMRPLPDLTLVWNETQRSEAVRLHGADRTRVEVTGAQCFDHWFGWPPRPRAEFCARVGLPDDRPFVLYTCFSPFKGAASEAEYVQRWLRTLRSAEDPAVAGVAVLIRPHPKRGAQWRDVDLSAFGNVALWPEEGQMVVDEEARADFFDSIHHSAAVVGINTSAMIEAGIVGRPVLTVLVPEFHTSQAGTLHFRYLCEVGGGLLRVARDDGEHVRQLAEVLRGEDAAAEASGAFLREFIRPRGLDVPGTPVFVDAIERLAATRPPVRTTPQHLRPLRSLLAPLARRARDERLSREKRRRRARAAAPGAGAETR